MYHHHDFANHMAARTAVMDYIESWYNRRRPHTYNLGLPPARALTEYQYQRLKNLTGAGLPMAMTTSSRLLWAAAHVERAALADDLALVEDAQWSSPSLCGQWVVEEVLAHLTAAASVGRFRWLVSVFGAKFNFDLHNHRRLTEHLGPTPADTLRRFGDVVTSTTSTFGPTAAWLGEVVVHSEDIRRPLGIVRAIPVEVVTTVANFYAKTSFTVDSKAKIEGLRLEATDGPFTARSGSLVTGTTIALTMAMADRGVYCHELSGPGAVILEDRCSASRSGETT